MLQFVFGRAFSGKTEYIHSQIEKENDGVFLLVPEQYTFETEKQMLKRIGSGFMGRVNVLSFSRMCEAAGQIYGGISGIRIDDSQRIILMGRAVKMVSARLSLFKKYTKNPEFIKQITDIISEFKLAGISFEELLQVANNLEENSLKIKLTEIAEIYAAYNHLLEKVYIDPLDDIEMLINKASSTDFFNNKTVYIDAFKGFTGSQIKLLKLMILKCKKVVITFCADNGVDKFGGVDVFSNIKSVANSLEKYARENGVQILDEVVLADTHFKYEDLKFLESSFSSAKNEIFDNAQNIVLGSLLNPALEVEFVLKTIRRLVRKQGYRYSDFVIIARDIEKYLRIIESLKTKYDIPCYLDKTRPLSLSLISRLALSALKAAKNVDTENILLLLKTGLLGISDDDIALLEEYTFIWDINGEDWCSDWTMDPDGIVTGEYKSSPEVLKERLSKLNTLRSRVIAPILTLRGSLNKSVREVSKALYGFIMGFEADKNLLSYCEKLEGPSLLDDKEFILNSWDAFISVLDNIVRCYDDETISADEYIDVFSLAISGYKIGSVPKTLDEVICGSADRIRTSGQKIAFVIGANQGEFPSFVGDNGLLLKSDRIRLHEAGLEISDRFNSFAVDEMFMFYSSVTAGSEKVYILCHSQELDGTKTDESSEFSRLKRIFGETKLSLEENMPETKEEAFSLLAKNKDKNSSTVLALSEYFSENEEDCLRLKNLNNMEKSGVHRLSKDVANKLFGDNLYLSASKIENYNGCAFSYFCRYVLNISPLKKADLDNMQRGTIVHYIMENVLRDFGRGIKDISDTEIKASVNKYMSIYLSDVEGAEFLNKPRFKFLYSMIAKMSLAVLLHIKEEFKVSSFEPVSFELEIAKNGSLPLFKLKFSGEKTLSLNGKIDRVDALKGVNGENYIRVVDYKTGSKEFHLPDVLYGLNMQMLVYLAAIKKLGTDLFGEVTPAGILYKPSKRSIQKEGEAKSLGFAMNGMIVDSEEILNGMDSTNSGKFAPKNTGKERKGNPILSPDDFDTVLSFVEKKICTTAEKITNGVFDVNPIKCDGYEACKYCDFSSVCGIEGDSEKTLISPLSNGQVITKMKEELGNV